MTTQTILNNTTKNVLSCTQAKELRYCNPIRSPQISSIRDPQIIRVDGRYFLTGTLPPYWQGPNPGVPLWSSSDLLHWENEGLLIDAARVAADAWYKDRFWAPEIHQTGGMFYLTFNCRNAVFPGPDGRDWLVYHLDDRDGTEQMAFDPMWIDDAGEINTDSPTVTPQIVRW